MQIRKKITNIELDRVKRDVKKEVWDGKGTYENFQRQHVDSLGSEPKKQGSSSRSVLPKNFSKWPGELKMEYLRKNLGNNIQNYVEGILEKFGIKKSDSEDDKNKKRGNSKDLPSKPKKKKKKKVKPPRIETPTVNPVPENETEGPVSVGPPPPREIEMIAPPVIDNDNRSWNSRIGYFASIIDIKASDQEISVYTDPKVEFTFDNMPEGYLSLKPNETWESEWIESGVIRGLDVNVAGKHTLNYARNGDFEI
jgi:hypothetical protein